MSFEAVAAIANTLLYEGYVLYPYRASSVKNQRRFPLGCVHPPAFCEEGAADRAFVRTECLLETSPATTLEVRVRFLQLMDGASGDAEEREVAMPTVRVDGARAFRQRFETTAIDGRGLVGQLDVAILPLRAGLARVTVDLRNETPFDGALYGERDAQRRAGAMPVTMVSAHTLLRTDDGAFVSITDPPAPFAEDAARCRNVGTWPVLVGPLGERTMVLSSPIILADHPEVAPESPGNLFDGTEIDEILTLRILTMTDEEKREARAGDRRARAILERTEALPREALESLHGALRNPGGRAHRRVQPGDRVRLAPRRNADIYDVVLAGKTGRVVSIETSFEDQVFVCIVLDDDPGQDLGLLGFPGHRFFYGLDEVERL